MDGKQQQIVDRTAEYLESKFSGEGSGHDYWHMYRVWQLAKHIGKSEAGVDHFTLELAALLHDIADWKFHDGDEEAGPRAAREWLEGQAVDNTIIEQVEDIIRTVSFKGANVKTEMKTIEGRIVFDADKLDAIGAIGIARTFAYGGMKGRAIYDPERPPEDHADAKAYMQSDGPTINHFYEKLLLLKDRMFTETGRQIAQQRHEIMEAFLKEFYAEWNGER